MKLILFLTIGFLAILNINGQNLDYRLPTPDNKVVSIGDLKGEQVTIIDFWATWCKPCVNAMPKINALYEKFKAQGVTVIGVSVDGPRSQSKVAPLIKTLGITYPVVLDESSSFAEEFSVSALPTLVILNNKGKKVFLHEGFSPGDEKLIEAEILKLLQ